ncbi:formate C-acetyltransferase [Eshraghiella crossota]|nr:formate C-acetyltransferase [Butyrivibrio crossotus]MBS6453407.1 formate C-acetyltransferase [Butyrivibrio sp.]MBD9030233.1 formate C-acetyltransferase [Butyrivibrio crossotus]MEE0315814.1 formate C-acetyltransferase [Butyrivibrio crossotus]OKZ36190.1 MAG: formate C-acetyltransferase [Butyrivibrio crossotus]UWO51689.1 formate C-acetyltransferase [Butyrivibrio crossotus]
MLDMEQWAGFEGRIWREEVNVRDFIQKNYKPYDGDESFLAEPTDATNKLWGALQKLQKEEREKGGVLDCETEVVSGLTAYGPGYIDESMKDLEQVVGLQTDKPLKRAFMPYGGIRMAEQAAESYGYEINPELKYVFENYMTTHNDAVFAAYTNEMKLARKTHVVTGLPDTYGRGRIVGDYRRVALYGIDYLIAQKEADKANCGCGNMYDDVIRLREEIAMQITALKGMKEMAKSYGYDISLPAKNAKEACQWLYFGYLAAIKTQNGAAMSVGRVSTFLDIYFERDLANGVLTESEAQEIIDHMTMKFRMVKFARIPSYNQLFSGDPTWATLEVGGIGMDGRSMVTKTDYRFLHTLENMGPSPEPNLTVLYSSALPEQFKKYAAHISIETSSIQYENDDVMKPVWGDDYSICCCVSATQTGKEIQFFGARANLGKTLLYAFNGGFDEKHRIQCGPKLQKIDKEVLSGEEDYKMVRDAYETWLDWLADIYVNVLNLIHYMHDKYYYEAAEMALIDTDVRRTFATGIAGFSHVIDSLSAIKYAKVKVIRDEEGITKDFEVEGDFPKYGNDDDRADDIGIWVLKTFLEKIKRRHTYRNSEPTTSLLTITSNVVYGEATGAMPDGRAAFTPFSPGASPSYGAEQNGLVASLNSVAKIPYHWSLDGISNTQTINPDALGHSKEEQVNNLVQVMDGYFDQGAHHLNVNVFTKDKLLDAQAHPEKEEYANFTIRVSGYAVKFISLTKKQQDDVIARTCHARL